MKGFCLIKSEIKSDELHDYIMHKEQYLESGNIRIFREGNGKFKNDKVFEISNGNIIVTDGVIFNKNELLRKTNCNAFSEAIEKLHQQKKTFFDEFRGEFSGLFHDSVLDETIVFTNHTSSKPVFYYEDNTVFIAASSVEYIADVMRILGKPVKPDINGAYFMLTIGWMLKDVTLVNGVKKLLPGHYISVNGSSVSLSRYHRFENLPMTTKSKEEIIENLDRLFVNAVRMEYEKDIEYGYRHIVTLSGGMDSRANVMVASELGYKDIKTVTTSYPHYADHTISQYISREMGYDFYFKPLSDPGFLTNIEEPVAANNGLVFYSGSAHLLNLLKNIDWNGFGLLHTGMIGDGVIGSFIKNGIHTQPRLQSVPGNEVFGEDKVRSIIQKIMSEYENVEMYNIYEKCFNGVFNGFWTISDFTEFASPFIEKEFLEFALTIPPEIKNRTKIQIEWLDTKHPRITDFATGRYHARPKPENFEFLVQTSRLRAAFNRKISKYIPNAMIPYNYWYRKNTEFRDYFDEYMKEYSPVLSYDKELEKNALEIFYKGSFKTKTRVITLIEAFRFYKF